MAHTSSTGVGKNFICKINNLATKLIEKHVPASTAKMLAVFCHEKVRKFGVKRVRKTSFYWTMTGRCRSASTAPLYVKMKRKQMAKKSDKTRAHIKFILENKQTNHCLLRLSLSKFQLQLPSLCSNFSSWLDNFGGARTPHTHTRTPPLPFDVSLFNCCMCVFFLLVCSATWFYARCLCC